MAKNVEFHVASKTTRLTLAYSQLNSISSDVIACVGNHIHILDLSHNDFRDLAFLKRFRALETLILDGNCKLDCTTFPDMKNLRVLWLNNCNLINIVEWLNVLRSHCPNLEELSMMCNPVGYTVLNGITEKQERKYRKQFIRLLPRLSHFDGVAVTDAERRKALKSKSLLTQLFGRVVDRKQDHIKDISPQLSRKCISTNSLIYVKCRNNGVQADYKNTSKRI